jgi:serine/threonine-protein kinase RsbW
MIRLCLPSELGCEKLVRQAISWLAPHLQLAAARIADLQTAVSEACINAVEHGNRMLSHLRVSVTLRVTETYLEVVVIDQGIVCFRPPTTPPPSIEDKLGGLAPARHMGLLLMQQLVDEADFVAAEPGRGNRVRLRIYGTHSNDRADDLHSPVMN